MIKPIRNIAAGVAVSASLIIGSVVTIEGGFSDHPDDTGGATMHGITEQVARSHGYVGDMRYLPLSTAKDIYTVDYVVIPNYDLVLEVSIPVGHKLIDAGVNTGTHRASLWYQRALNSLNRAGRDYNNINEDGTIGPATISAYKSLQRIRGKVKACELVIKLIDAQQAYHYISLKHHSSFTVGWIDNRIQNVSIKECSD